LFEDIGVKRSFFYSINFKISCVCLPFPLTGYRLLNGAGYGFVHNISHAAVEEKTG